MLTTNTFRPTLNRNGHRTKDGNRIITITIYQLGTRQRATLSTHIQVPASDFHNGKVQPTNPDHDIYNRRIRRIIRSLMEYDDELQERGISPTPAAVKDAYLHHTSRSSTLKEFADSVIQPSDRCPSTKQAYRSMVDSIEQVRPSVTMQDLSYDLIERWRQHMRSMKLSENTIKGRMKQLRCVTLEAIKRNVITEDPFKWITIGNIGAKVGYLSLSEIRRLENTDLTGRQAIVRDLFLLSCYTGLRWSDITSIHEAAIHKGVLHKTMRKTQRDISIPIGTLFWGKGLGIIQRYPDLRKLTRRLCNSTANKIIKAVCKDAHISKPVTFHWARKSFCSNLSLLGLPTHEISLLMGHTKTDVTKTHYLFSQEKALEKSVRKIFKV